MNERLQVIAKQIACPVAVALFFAAIVWRLWPLDASADDIGTLVYALVGAVLVLSPDAVLSVTPISSHRQLTAKEADALFGEQDVIRVIGCVVLFDALTGWGKWLVWTWW